MTILNVRVGVLTYPYIQMMHPSPAHRPTAREIFNCADPSAAQQNDFIVSVGGEMFICSCEELDSFFCSVLSTVNVQEW
jgi:hypothetical protein